MPACLRRHAGHVLAGFTVGEFLDGASAAGGRGTGWPACRPNGLLSLHSSARCRQRAGHVEALLAQVGILDPRAHRPDRVSARAVPCGSRASGPYHRQVRVFAVGRGSFRQASREWWVRQSGGQSGRDRRLHPGNSAGSNRTWLSDGDPGRCNLRLRCMAGSETARFSETPRAQVSPPPNSSDCSGTGFRT